VRVAAPPNFAVWVGGLGFEFASLGLDMQVFMRENREVLSPGKRGQNAEAEPPVLRRLGLDRTHWSGQVKGVGCGNWRMVGSVEALIARAEVACQRWMRGSGYARKLTATR